MFYQRVRFGDIQVTGITNPFTQIKLQATFTHAATARQFKVPVVVEAQLDPGYIFPVWFSAPFEDSWTLTLQDLTPAGGAYTINWGTLPPPGTTHTFSAKDSGLRGWWRPDVASSVHGNPAEYPYTVVVPTGTGSSSGDWSYTRPGTTAFFNIANPLWTTSQVANALDWASSAGFNRIHIKLNWVKDRAVPNNLASANTQNHTIFHKLNPNPAAATFRMPDIPGVTAADLDLERFDLAQWVAIDSVIAAAAARNMEVGMGLVFNTDDFDYEKLYVSSSAAMPLSPPLSAGAAFTDHLDMYLWYVCGRLGTYPNVHCLPMHKWNHLGGSGHGGATGPADDPFDSSVLLDFLTRLHAIDPYLGHDHNWKIVSDNPRRGTLYGRTSFVAASNNWSLLLSDNQSVFTTPSFLNFGSVIGLQRGGELGIISVAEGENSLLGSTSSGFLSHPCLIPPTSTQTQAQSHWALLAGGNERPIFIEEDWTSTVDLRIPGLPMPNPAPSSFGNDDNPYYAGDGTWGPGGPGTHSWTYQNPNKFPFINDNIDGMRKATRDGTWMSGMICQGYLAYWSPKWKDLSRDLTYVTSWQAHLSAQKLCDLIDWQRFSYAPGLVADQYPLHLGQAPFHLAGGGNATYPAISTIWPPSCTHNLPNWATLPGTSGRVPIEQRAIGAVSDHSVPQFVIYCPANYESSPGVWSPVRLTLDLSPWIAPGEEVDIRYWHPDQASTYSNKVTLVVTSPAAFDSPLVTPTSTYLGEFNEYVLLINPPF